MEASLSVKEMSTKENLKAVFNTFASVFFLEINKLNF